MCYVIGSVATDTTSWLLMTIDFLFNILLSVWIIWSRKRQPDKMQKQIALLQDLAVYELVEFLAPLSFIFVLAIAYYGPNSEIIGNIGNSYWGFTAIEDIIQSLLSMGIFFMVDFSSTLISAAILWYTCRINLLKVFLELLKEFGKSFCVVQGFLLVLVCKFVKDCLTNLLLCN